VTPLKTDGIIHKYIPTKAEIPNHQFTSAHTQTCP